MREVTAKILQIANNYRYITIVIATSLTAGKSSLSPVSINRARLTHIGAHNCAPDNIKPPGICCCVDSAAALRSMPSMLGDRLFIVFVLAVSVDDEEAT